MSPDIHPKVRAFALDKLRARMRRLRRLLLLNAPDAVIANEAGLVAEAGRMLAPYAVAAMRAGAEDSRGRRAAGVCVDVGCERDAVPSPTNDGLCQEHLDELDAEELELAAEDDDLEDLAAMLKSAHAKGGSDVPPES